MLNNNIKLMVKIPTKIIETTIISLLNMDIKGPPPALCWVFFFQTVNVGHETEALCKFLFVGFVSAHLCEI